MKNTKKTLRIIIIVLGLIFISLVTWHMKNQKNNNQQPSDQSSSNQTVETGSLVGVDYIGSYEGGEVFDTSIQQVAQNNGLYHTGRQYKPLEFTVGQHRVVPGFESGVVGMKVGETKKLILPPEQAYGQSNPQLITGMSLQMFKDAGIEPEVGKTYPFGGGYSTMNGKVIEVTGDIVKIDFNPEMAGKTLIFEVTIRSIK